MTSSDSTSLFAALSQLTVEDCPIVDDAASVGTAQARTPEKNTARAIAASLERTVSQ